MKAVQLFSISQIEGMRDNAGQVRAIGQQLEQLIRSVNSVTLAQPANGQRAGQMDAVWLVAPLGACGQNVKVAHNLGRAPVGAMLLDVPLAGGEASAPARIEVMAADAQSITLRTTGTSRTLFVDTTPQTLVNSLTKTTFNTLTIPADLLHAGDVLRYRWHANYQTTGTPNLTLFVEWDSGTGTPLSGAVATVNNASGEPALVEGSLAIQTAGAAGVTNHDAIRQIGTTLAGVKPVQTTGLALNAQRTLTFSAQWGAMAPQNTITQDLLSVELISATMPVGRLLLF